MHAVKGGAYRAQLWPYGTSLLPTRSQYVRSSSKFRSHRAASMSHVQSNTGDVLSTAADPEPHSAE